MLIYCIIYLIISIRSYTQEAYMVKLKPNTGPGRPTVVTQNAVLRLETAFALGCNVKVALAFAELSKDAYSRLLQRQPEFRERFERLRETPVLQAKRNVAMAIAAGDVAVSRWYLEKRCPEYSPRAQLDVNVTQQPLSEEEILRRLARFIPDEKLVEV
jgi:hypothetical protein